MTLRCLIRFGRSGFTGSRGIIRDLPVVVCTGRASAWNCNGVPATGSQGHGATIGFWVFALWPECAAAVRPRAFQSRSRPAAVCLCAKTGISRSGHRMDLDNDQAMEPMLVSPAGGQGISRKRPGSTTGAISACGFSMSGRRRHSVPGAISATAAIWHHTNFPFQCRRSIAVSKGISLLTIRVAMTIRPVSGCPRLSGNLSK